MQRPCQGIYNFFGALFGSEKWQRLRIGHCTQKIIGLLDINGTLQFRQLEDTLIGYLHLKDVWVIRYVPVNAKTLTKDL